MASAIPFITALKRTLAVLGESVKHAPKGSSTFTTLTAIVERGDAQTIHTDKETTSLYHVSVKCLASADPVYGGVATPQVGDEWQIPMQQGGTLVNEWMAATAQPIRGGWRIQLTKEKPDEKGGMRKQ